MEKTQGYAQYSKVHGSKPKDSEGGSQGSNECNSSFEDHIRPPQTPKDLSFLHDVPLEISAELGRCTLTIRKLLSLVPGSIVTLSEEPQVQVSVRANGNEVARGEVVTVNDHFGIRITEINDHQE
jgi:flagellar motor switch protein FliN/FliY